MAFKPVLWSPCEIEYLKEHHALQPINQLTIALAKSRNAIVKKLKEINGDTAYPANQTIGGIKSRIGKRDDLGGMFLRSAWESNFVRYLKTRKDVITIEYEPTDFTFWQFGIKKGTVSYTPDFKLTMDDGVYFWIEVKGFMKRQDKTKIRRFQKYYPQEANRLMAVVGSPNSQTAKFFQESGVSIFAYYNELNKKYKHTIPHWE